MKTRTYLPSDQLKPYIDRLEIHEQTEEKTYKVLPGTGLVLGFQFSGSISQLRENEIQRLSPAGITGVLDQFRIYRSARDTGSVLVYFKEGGAAAFFRTPLNEIFSESVSLDNFILRSELLIFEEELCEAKSANKKIAVVEKFLLSRLKVPEPDKLVMTAVALIYESKGTVRIRELMDQLHISQAPLEKRFRKLIGASPKKFASIIRMKHAIANFRPGESLTHLGYEAGFYDQAHFIKEFRVFTGDTPRDFLKGDR